MKTKYFFISSTVSNSKESAKQRRLDEVLSSLRSYPSTTHELTAGELEFGTRLAWRNAPRCPGRIQWRGLRLRDAREVRTAQDAFRSLCEHIRYLNDYFLKNFFLDIGK